VACLADELHERGDLGAILAHERRVEPAAHLSGAIGGTSHASVARRTLSARRLGRRRRWRRRRLGGWRVRVRLDGQQPREVRRELGRLALLEPVLRVRLRVGRRRPGQVRDARV